MEEVVWEIDCSSIAPELEIQVRIDGKNLSRLIQEASIHKEPASIESQTLVANMSLVEPEPDNSRKRKNTRMEKNKPEPVLSRDKVLRYYAYGSEWDKNESYWSKKVRYHHAAIHHRSKLGRVYCAQSGNLLWREARDTLFCHSTTIDIRNCFYSLMVCFLQRHLSAYHSSYCMFLFINNLFSMYF